jgi:hypothetical protein
MTELPFPAQHVTLLFALDRSYFAVQYTPTAFSRFCQERIEADVIGRLEIKSFWCLSNSVGRPSCSGVHCNLRLTCQCFAKHVQRSHLTLNGSGSPATGLRPFPACIRT